MAPPPRGTSTPRARFQPFVLGRYAVLAPLAVGGMARVYLAEPLGVAGFTRPVVIKLILDHFASDQAFVGMFVDEASIAINLSHPNVVQVLELQQDNGRFFMVLEWVDGPDLARLMRALREEGDRLDVELAVYAVWCATRGLGHVHTATDPEGAPLHVVHRDVTPSNLLIHSNGTVKLSDFGVAKARGRLTQTQTGQIKGKLAYMAPEQVQSVVDQRSDLFSAGIVLWEALTGTLLFHGGSDIQTIEMVLRKQVPPPSQLNRKVPASVDRVVMRALDRNPDARFQTAEEMSDALLESLGKQPDKLAAALSKLVRRHFTLMTRQELAALPRPDPTRTESSPLLWSVGPEEAPSERTTVDTPAALPATEPTAATVVLNRAWGFESVPDTVYESPAAPTGPSDGSPVEVTPDVVELDLEEEVDAAQVVEVDGMATTMPGAAAPPLAGQVLRFRHAGPPPTDLLCTGASLWELLRAARLPPDATVQAGTHPPLRVSELAQRLAVDGVLPLPGPPQAPWALSRPRTLLHEILDRRLTGALLVAREGAAAPHAALWLQQGRLQYVQLAAPTRLFIDGLLEFVDRAQREPRLDALLRLMAGPPRPLQDALTEVELVARGRFRMLLDIFNGARLEDLLMAPVWAHAPVVGVACPFSLPPGEVEITQFLGAS